MSDKDAVRFRVVPSEDGMMLSRLVARRLPDIGHDRARELVKAGAVYMGHLRVRIPTVRVAPGERVTVYPQALQHEELPLETLRFVHRDPAFVVLDKPPGVVVAATKQSARGTLSEALRRQLEHEGVVRPYVGVVHRLDREASGLVLFTVRGIANKSIHRQFVEHRIQRTYRLLVRGEAPSETTCDAPLDTRARTVRVATAGESTAKPARTHLCRLRPAHPRPDTSLLEATLETGRTHQIRVHAAHLGHPIVGDQRYGGGQDPNGLHLHAHRLTFTHPIDDTPIDIVATPPDWAQT